LDPLSRRYFCHGFGSDGRRGAGCAMKLGARQSARASLPPAILDRDVATVAPVHFQWRGWTAVALKGLHTATARLSKKRMLLDMMSSTTFATVSSLCRERARRRRR